MDDWFETDDSYVKRQTRDLLVGDVVVWGQRHEQRPRVAEVIKTSWRRFLVVLEHPDGQTVVLERFPGRTIWWALR